MSEWTPFKDWSSAVLAIITNKFHWSWSVNSRCKYITIRIDMRDGSAVLKDREGNEISVEELTRQLSRGGQVNLPVPTLEELGVDCSNLKQ